MRFRCFAFAVALLVAVGPAIDVVCELDCGPPRAESPSCHGAAAASDSATMRGNAHACGGAHLPARPALLTGTSARAQLDTIAALPPVFLAHAFMAELRIGALGAMRDPPGLNSSSTTSFTTVLRI